MKRKSGVSIVVVIRNDGSSIDRLMKSFFEFNTHPSLEFVIVDLCASEHAKEILSPYIPRAFFRYIRRNPNDSSADFAKMIGQKTRYPYLLFLNDVSVFMSDALPRIVEVLADLSIHAVGSLACDNPEKILDGKVNNKHDVGIDGDFLSCRKADFMSYGGFGKELTTGLMNDNFLKEFSIWLGTKSTSCKKLVVQNNKDFPCLHILFVLPQPADSNCGYHVERLVAGLQAQGAACMVAVPQKNYPPQLDGNKTVVASHPSFPVFTYDELQKHGISFSDGRRPDIIHAWTPREGVRQFVTSLTAINPCPVVVHLEDNEEYLLETAVGRSFGEIAKLSLQEIDKIVPNNRYHPIHGRRWLEQVQGITMIIDSLNKFNVNHLPSLTILPPVDERLFYPRPINWQLRNQMNIPENKTVLVYTGNVHAGNRDEVLTLYKSVQLLNQQGHSTVLIRTGINAIPLVDGDDAWINSFEINMGWVHRKDVAGIMAAADVLVQPGTPGSFNDYRIPCKLPEYFAMGRPVILPKVNIGALARHEEDAYVLDQADSEAIAKAVLEIRKDKNLSEKLTTGSVNFYLRQICTDRSDRILYRFYQQVCTSAHVGADTARSLQNPPKQEPPDANHGAAIRQTVAEKAAIEKKIQSLESENRKLIERIRRMPIIDPFCLRNPETLWETKADSEFGIIVFGHTRVGHIQATLESLKRQNAIQYVNFWMDGYQGRMELKKKTDTVYDMVQSYSVASIRRHSGQLGFRKILIQGLVEMCREYENILVLEDDCFPTRDAVQIFREEIRQIADDSRIFSVYGHHFLTPSERETCPRFQGWGWGTTRQKLLPVLRQLIDCYSMTEERYLEFVKTVLTPEIKARIDVTPPRMPSYCLNSFFAWDETLCLLTALNDQVHKPTVKRTIYNCGMGDGSAHFTDTEKFRKPAFNLISLNEVWDYF